METGDARSKIFAQCCSRGTQDVAAFPSNRGYHRSLSLYFQGSLGTSAGKTLLGQISSRNINDNLSMQAARYCNFLLSIYTRNIFFLSVARSIPLNTSRVPLSSY